MSRFGLRRRLLLVVGAAVTVALLAAWQIRRLPLGAILREE